MISHGVLYRIDHLGSSGFIAFCFVMSYPKETGLTHQIFAGLFLLSVSTIDLQKFSMTELQRLGR